MQAFLREEPDEETRLTEELISKQLGMSKSPVREALNTLHAEGLIRIEARIRDVNHDAVAKARGAHRTLPNTISTDCCSAIRIDLLNGDYRPGVTRIELMLRDTSSKAGSSLFLGSIPVPSSQLKYISMERPPVSESFRFRMPAAAPPGKHFDEITVVVKPSSERALGGSKIAIQNFVLIP